MPYGMALAVNVLTLTLVNLQRVKRPEWRDRREDEMSAELLMSVFVLAWA
jgi:hypothetical protein